MPRAILPEPPDELKRLSQELGARLRVEIDAHGAIPFSRYMERALYEPGLGYYSAGLHKLGAGGDFVTAPELGRLFAAALARQIAQLGQALGKYDVLEIGAGTGQLAVDLLGELAPSVRPGRYLILETSADLRQLQRERLAAMAPAALPSVEWLDRPPATAWDGVLVANEVLDALPVERFQVGDQGFERLGVTERDGQLAWAGLPAPASLVDAIRHVETGIQRPFATGYRSELQMTLQPWLDSVTANLRRGLALFIDYGYPRREYYSAERRDGTLICHYRHKAHDDVFFWPGLQDLTAWVDFTALAEAAELCKLEVCGYCNQAMFLLGCGLDQVLSASMAAAGDGGTDLANEARQLLMPGFMGERFQVMGLARGLDADLQRTLQGFSLQDLRYRL